jgi:hypothetical protein
MKMPNYRISFVLGFVGSICIFLNAIISFINSNEFLLEFGQVPEVSKYALWGGVFLVVGFLALIGCIKGKKFGSYSMAIAGFFMLLFLSWVPAALLIAAAYATRNETPIPQKEPINLQSG